MVNFLIRIKEKIIEFKELSVSLKLKLVFPYAFASILFVRFCEYFRICEFDALKILSNTWYLYSTHMHIGIKDILYGTLIGIAFVKYTKFKLKLHHKNEKAGIEHGSAKWGEAKDIKPFVNENPFYNIILSKTERLSMAQRMPKFKLNRNKHVLITGGSGSGKTYGIVKPNLCQLHSSYVVTDPKGLTS